MGEWSPTVYKVDNEATARFDEWYQRREDSIFERRLDTYGHRLMLIHAAMLGRTVIDLEVVEGVIALLDYQLDVRRECDPVDAENSIAQMEEKIRRALARGPLKERELKRRCHYERHGLWIWNKALENLKNAGEVRADPKTARLALRMSPRPPQSMKRRNSQSAYELGDSRGEPLSLYTYHPEARKMVDFQ
jgi:hypothetical protein